MKSTELAVKRGNEEEVGTWQSIWIYWHTGPLAAATVKQFALVEEVVLKIN